MFFESLLHTFYFTLDENICLLYEGSSTEEIRQSCYWSGGYLPTYEDIFKPLVAGSLFAIRIDISESF